MADRPQPRQPPGVVAAVLLICTVVGLFAGFGTSKLANHLTNAAGLGRNGPTNTVAPTATATSLPTATAIPSELTGFKVQAQVSPSAVAPGQQFTITATVIAQDGVTPLDGVLCTIGSPGNGSASLFPQWPAGKVTNSSGEAAWTLRAPSVARGSYTIKVVATGYKGYFWFFLVPITITG